MPGVDLQALTVVAVALVGLGVVFWLVVRSQVFAAAALLITFVLTDAIRDRVDLSVTLGSFHVYAMDVLSGMLLVVGAYRSLYGIRARAHGATFILAGLLVFHVARGVADFGLQEALNSSRSWIGFVGPLLFAAAPPRPWGPLVWHLTAITGVVLAAVSVPYLVADGLHPATAMVVRHGQLVTARPIVAAGALVILEAAVIFLATRWPSPSVARWCATALAIDIVVLQHRTVWAAALAVGLVGFALYSRSALARAPSLVYGMTGVLLIALPALVWLIGATPSFHASLTETTARQSTFVWRAQSWQELVASHRSIGDLAVGGPSGASWSRLIDGSLATASPHDAYVEAFLRFGLPGVALFAGLLLTLWMRRRQLGRRLLTPNAVGLLLLAQAVYSVAYMLEPAQGLILGVLVSALFARAPESKPGMIPDLPGCAVRNLALARAR